ncbi:unnamed protein product [Litomosoides sigmodontis]|uniref:DUF7596 domain-containing protein n=1 Tax=Litomosoides sigmodontis TaxID=42156 RepID=A0A3P6TDL9_LITSI|nr:unnamed protein product [Litomosoides sigmodontis]
MGWNSLLSQAVLTDTEVLHEMNDVPELKSAFIRNSDGTLSGLVSMISCTTNQAYCMVVQIDKSISDKYISIKPTDDPQCFQIVDIQDVAEDLSLQPIFIQVHHNPNRRLPLQHLIDQAAERALGRLNLDLEKNVTVDLTDQDDMNIWRDKAGFVVRDKMQLCELIVNKNEFQRTLKAVENVKISEFNGSQMSKVVEFDTAVSSTDRSTFLEYLFKDANVRFYNGFYLDSNIQMYKIICLHLKTVTVQIVFAQVLIAENEDTSKVDGYGVFRKDRILSVYANAKETASAIVQEILQTMNYEEV